MRTYISNVTISNNRAHIKNTNIPVDLIVGRGVSAIKKDYTWLTKKQIEDALKFAQEVLKSQDFNKYASPKAA